jgi:hypothetical protein
MAHGRMTLNGIAPPGPVPSTICDGRPQPRSIKSRIATSWKPGWLSSALESGYMLLVPHTTALPQAEPVTIHAAAGPARTTGESSLLRIFSISLEPSFSHGPTLANGRHIGFGGIHWDFSALFPQRYHTSAALRAYLQWDEDHPGRTPTATAAVRTIGPSGNTTENGMAPPGPEPSIACLGRPRPKLTRRTCASG